MKNKIDQSTVDQSRSRVVPDIARTRLRLIDWAGRDPGLTPPNKAVILAVVAHADGHGVCTATDRDLARASHTSVPTVQRSLRLLEASRVIERANAAPEGREIRLIPGEQPLVVVALDSLPEKKIKQQQEQQTTTDPTCSPATIPNTSGTPGHEDSPGHDTQRLVALLIAQGVTEKMARRLVRQFPGRVVPQVEAHRHRNVSNPAGSLVVAIRDNWPTDPPKPQRQPTAKVREEEIRKAREDERQTAHNALAAANARRRAEDEQVRRFWEGLAEGEREAFDEEAVEASPHRDEIRCTRSDTPFYRAQCLAARREHIRRKLGLPPEAES